MLRNQSPGGKSPSPGPITNTLPVKPIGPPSHNEPISATPAEATNKKWGSKNLAETLKGQYPKNRTFCRFFGSKNSSDFFSKDWYNSDRIYFNLINSQTIFSAKAAEKPEKPKLLERQKVTESKKVKSEVKKPTKSAPPKTVTEKVEKAAEKIEKSVNKENVENGLDDGKF